MLAMAVNVLSLGTVTALFLAATTRAALPAVYALGAAFGAFSAAAMASLATRVSRAVEVAGCFLLLSLSLLAAFWLLPAAPPGLLFVVHPVATGLSALGVVQAYALINDCLDAEQAKRVLPAIGAGGTLGAMAAGGGMAWAAPRLGVANLLPLAAATCLAAAVVAVVFLLRHAPRFGSEPATAQGSRALSKRPPGATSVVSDLLRSPLLRQFALLQMLLAALSTLLKFSLESKLQAQLGVNHIAVFLGVLNLCANAAALCVQTMVEARVLRRFGLMFGVLAAPVILTAGACVLLVASGLWVVASVRLSESVVRFSVARTAEDLVLLPVPSVMRRRAKTVITSVLSPLAVFFASLMILLIGATRGSSTHVLMLMLMLGCCGVLAALSLRTRYVAQLLRSLKRRRVTLDASLRVSEPQTLSGLVAGLPRTDGSERVALLRALASQRLRGAPALAQLTQVAREVRGELRCGHIVRLSRAALRELPLSAVQRRSASAELDFQAQRLEEMLFLLLALIYPPDDMLRAQLSYVQGERRVRAFALELLAQNLEPVLRNQLLPYLASLPEEEQIMQAERALDVSRQAVLRSALPRRLHWLQLYLSLAEPENADEERLMPSLEEIMILRTVTLFSRLSPEELQSIAEIAERRSVAAGVTLFREGDPGDALYVILRGELAVSRGGAAVATLRDGECFGELALLDRGLRTATVTANTACELSRIGDEDFRELLERYPSIALAMLSILARRVTSLLEKPAAA